MVLSSTAALAATPEADCGVGATIVGTDDVGKVTLGQEPSNTCTLTFLAPATNPPACTAVNETNGGNYSVPIGTKTTRTTLVLGGRIPWTEGDVISFSCAGY